MEKNTRAQVGGAEGAPHVDRPSKSFQKAVIKTHSVAPTGQTGISFQPGLKAWAILLDRSAVIGKRPNSRFKELNTLYWPRAAYSGIYLTRISGKAPSIAKNRILPLPKPTRGAKCGIFRAKPGELRAEVWGIP
jgi:hypothetical protein